VHNHEDRLPPEVLRRATELPLKPAAVSLDGKFIRLVPLDLDRDVEPLFVRSNGSEIRLGDRHVPPYDADSAIWQHMFAGPFASAAEFGAFLHSQVQAENGLCLCVFDRATEQQIGVCNYMTNVPAHLKIELGSIWYSPVAQRTNANLEATYLMLRHAFELGYRRVEWKCDANNERSRKSALRMGFTFEGVHQHHMIVKGKNRDTAWFRILDTEWPDVRDQLEQLLRRETLGNVR
jgi:RimJ/RimL family protein N-acetyltransferase